MVKDKNGVALWGQKLAVLCSAFLCFLLYKKFMVHNHNYQNNKPIHNQRLNGRRFEKAEQVWPYEVANEIYAHSNKVNETLKNDVKGWQKACSPKLLSRSNRVKVNCTTVNPMLWYFIMTELWVPCGLCERLYSKIPKNIEDNMTGLLIDKANLCEIITF